MFRKIAHSLWIILGVPIIRICVLIERGAPTDQLREATDRILEILQDEDLKSNHKRQVRGILLRSAISTRFDFTEMGKRSLGGERLDREYADVESLLANARSATYTMNYRLRLIHKEWGVYDVVMENVSIVNNYRSQFSRIISRWSYEEVVRRMRHKSVSRQN